MTCRRNGAHGHERSNAFLPGWDDLHVQTKPGAWSRWCPCRWCGWLVRLLVDRTAGDLHARVAGCVARCGSRLAGARPFGSFRGGVRSCRVVVGNSCRMAFPSVHQGRWTGLFSRACASVAARHAAVHQPGRVLRFLAALPRPSNMNRPQLPARIVIGRVHAPTRFLISFNCAASGFTV